MALQKFFKNTLLATLLTGVAAGGAIAQTADTIKSGSAIEAEEANMDITEFEQTQTIADRYDPDNLRVAVNLATLLNLDTLTTGGTLNVTLPGGQESVDLPIIGVGKIDPDILSADQMVDPDTQDRTPKVGVQIDLSPLYGSTGQNHAVSYTFDTNEDGSAMRKPAASKETLDSFNVSDDIAKAYLDTFGELGSFEGGQKFENIGVNMTDDPSSPFSEIHPATAQELNAIGMTAAAKQVSRPAPKQSALANN
ncbi:MAG: hypothetical protein CMP22_02925 [Rickettsiales bacterium]|nr:hypothetical protein [Rickettsiales bacterium]|tara:strand:+ start:1402 stop:2157 length:756 start_codon:yes stop_codon:yes gene_type:complete